MRKQLKVEFLLKFFFFRWKHERFVKLIRKTDEKKTSGQYQPYQPEAAISQQKRSFFQRSEDFKRR